MLENGFLIPCWTTCVDLGWIGEGRKLTNFEQKPWAIAHGIEQGGFWQVLEIAPNSLKRRLSAWKWISNTLLDYLCWFGVNWRGSKIDRFWAKGLGYSPWFWTGPILAIFQIAPNSLKRRLSAWKCISNTLRDYRCRFGMNWRGSKIERFWAKGLGYSPWFWTGPILARLANRSKLPETPPKCLKMHFWYLAGL